MDGFTFQPPPTRTPLLDEKGVLSTPWLRYFQQISLALSRVIGTLITDGFIDAGTF